MIFDFIVVGAGSAGCIVASRLSESGRHSVLLIEAGGEDKSFWFKIPVGYAKSYYNPEVNWMYRTAPSGRTMRHVMSLFVVICPSNARCRPADERARDGLASGPRRVTRRDRWHSVASGGPTCISIT